ncbi:MULTISPECIES: N-acetylmuramate alpha-1-phosphate uridylyltransferase MurU [Pandoraea]|uniref:N-acetylmuramate alpha-1-phosphate uridylyltransferase MurU n=1 Tax=Pandoraea TaxID=93217 RepID=UPI001F5D928A|nr:MULTISPECIES: nucleotidyltransferase family protein [Pandoraea]MCI3203771.1 mannose-1-phosphate guanylyltransferase [Pandoraea sp. LA3]MDN4581797.1 mannose-1-phosphate guanylyltransferase [Pandoraea capi]
MKAMIFAAGRGERMRPLTDTTPKPLLSVGGKPIVVWQIEALARAGFTDIVINHAWLGAQIEATLGDGSAFGVRLAYSAEAEALETAGGIANARTLLEGDGNVFLAVSGDIFTAYDYATLRPQAARLATQAEPGMHLVMVPNPPFHPKGDFALDATGHLSLPDDAPSNAMPLTFGNIALYDLRLFDGIAPGTRLALTPLYRRAIAAGQASGERFDGVWENVGTPAQLAALDAEVRARHDVAPGSRIA